MAKDRPAGDGPRTKAAIQTLESLDAPGVRQLGKPRRRAPTGTRPADAAIPSPGAAPVRSTTAPSAAPATTIAPAPVDGDSLERIRQQVAGCTLCDELCTTRTQTVFGVGNPHARLCFLGEAPGADEDRQGEPFVGRAGQLLDQDHRSLHA